MRACYLIACLKGRVAEWSMALVLKTGNVNAFGGSNPSSSSKLVRLLREKGKVSS